MNEAIQLKNIVQIYNGKQVVSDVSFDVLPGEFVSLLGPSGCGKTTTLRMIAGFALPAQGTVLLGGKDITSLPPEKRNVGFVFQNYALWPHMTVCENIQFGLKLRRKTKKQINATVDEVLSITGLGGLENRLPRQLSGGQQQRVSLARAIALEPAVLLLDEPLSNLDRALRVTMRRELKELQQRLNMTTLFVTHDQEEALSMSSRIILMNQGKVSRIATPQELYENPQSDFIAGFTGNTNFFDGTVTGIAGDIATVQCDSLTLTTPHNGAVRQGDKVKLLLRPERIRLDRGDGPDDIVLSADIGLIEYFGSTIRYVTRLADGRELYVESHNTSRDYKTGDRISLYIKPQHFRFIDAAKG